MLRACRLLAARYYLRAHLATMDLLGLNKPAPCPFVLDDFSQKLNVHLFSQCWEPIVSTRLACRPVAVEPVLAANERDEQQLEHLLPQLMTVEDKQDIFGSSIYPYC
eukprot:scaffold336537_cov39-Prasinocladus_malaysianus.AAC.1